MNDEQAQANLHLALDWIDATHRGKRRDRRALPSRGGLEGSDRRRRLRGRQAGTRLVAYCAHPCRWTRSSCWRTTPTPCSASAITPVGS
jgi:hypothetical protein